MKKSKKHKKQSQREPVTKMTFKKKVLFYSVLVLIPFLFFIILELILRFIHYGDDLNLIVIKGEKDNKVYELNPKVGELYFSKMDISIPELYPQSFEFEKSPNTYRIFCLGGSTTASFPHELNARFSSLLHDRLSAIYPHINFEVINVGMSAINSYTVKDFVRQLVHYKPDLFLMYMGHNEFYGAYGVGSTQSLGKNRTVINLYLHLHHVKIVQFLRNVIGSVQHYFYKQESSIKTDSTLMQAMVQNKTIAWKSKDYQTTKNAFQKNLLDIIEFVRKQEIPIIISNLVCNDKDFEPFESLSSSQLTPTQKQTWQQLFDQGISFEKKQQYEEALNNFLQAAAIDSSPAQLHFCMGKCNLALGNIVKAKQSFQHARHLDALRFRASEEFNAIIDEACKQRDIPFVNMKAVFEEHSSHDIIGNELMLEHLHPNFNGNFLMAKAFTQAIVESGYAIHPAEDLQFSDDNIRKRSHVTDFDLEIAFIKIENLTEHWPYKHKITLSDPSKKQVTQITRKYLQGKIGWNHGHYELANYYVQNKQHDKAIKEYEAVIRVMPTNYFPYYQIGDIYFKQNKFRLAADKFSQAIQHNQKSPAIYAKLAISKMYLNSYAEAKKYFDATLNLNNQVQKLNKDEIITALYYSSICDIHLNELNTAKQKLKMLLNISPEHPQANELLQQLIHKGVSFIQ